jgi:hypothetical protein
MIDEGWNMWGNHSCVTDEEGWSMLENHSSVTDICFSSVTDW